MPGYKGPDFSLRITQGNANYLNQREGGRQAGRLDLRALIAGLGAPFAKGTLLYRKIRQCTVSVRVAAICVARQRA